MTGTTLPTDPADPEVLLAEAEIAALSKPVYPARTQECDMVMKGGITSGVVYPLTVCKLATKYRLRGIGGTSAGAIAAALAAAAEYRRQNDEVTPQAGFQALAGLPTEFVPPKLQSLFQPHPDARGIFAVLLAAVDPAKSGLGKAANVVATMVRQRPAWFLGGVFLVLAVVLPGLVVTTGFPIEGIAWWRIVIGLVLPVALALTIGLLLAAAGLALSALRILPERDFGITDGATHDPSSGPALTEWLADKIDEVAGIDDPTKCLTLGDLWGEDAEVAWSRFNQDDEKYAAEVGPVGRAKQLRTIDLEVMTTNLTLRRPFRLPFSQQTFFFDRAEMLGLFPKRVVETMSVVESDHLNPRTGEKLWYFPGPGAPAPDRRPGPESLPVVVMARMSLSFPALIAAVPLYAVDRNGDFSVVRHLFSDGGVSSNFPMHFFDSLLPRRPTFGVNLASPHPVRGKEPWRPDATGGGLLARAHPTASVMAFVAALRDTMQNWADNKQVGQRGYADRVVEIRLSASEGGLNLSMAKDTILRLAARGAKAGDRLLEFDEHWDTHRVIRYRTAMTRLNEALDGLRQAWLEDEEAYARLLRDFPQKGVPGASYLRNERRDVDWRAEDLKATRELLAAIESWETARWPALAHDKPAPSPVLRMAPE